MPEGLDEAERQQWLEDLGQLVDATGRAAGTIEQRPPGQQPIWAMWWTEKPGPTTEDTAPPPA